MDSVFVNWRKKLQIKLGCIWGGLLKLGVVCEAVFSKCCIQLTTGCRFWNVDSWWNEMSTWIDNKQAYIGLPGYKIEKAIRDPNHQIATSKLRCDRQNWTLYKFALILFSVVSLIITGTILSPTLGLMSMRNCTPWEEFFYLKNKIKQDSIEKGKEILCCKYMFLEIVHLLKHGPFK